MVYLENNKDNWIEYLKNSIPELKVVAPEATYLLWIDISSLKIGSAKFTKKLEELAKLRVISGVTFGEDGDNFIRVNIACPLNTLKDGLQRLKKGVEEIKALEI